MTDNEISDRLYQLIQRLDARIVELEDTYQMRRCPDCDATWEAKPDDPCPWCRQALLKVPTTAAINWAKRLRRAVETGLVTAQEAELALERYRKTAA